MSLELVYWAMGLLHLGVTVRLFSCGSFPPVTSVTEGVDEQGR